MNQQGEAILIVARFSFSIEVEDSRSILRISDPSSKTSSLSLIQWLIIMCMKI